MHAYRFTELGYTQLRPSIEPVRLRVRLPSMVVGASAPSTTSWLVAPVCAVWCVSRLLIKGPPSIPGSRAPRNSLHGGMVGSCARAYQRAYTSQLRTVPLLDCFAGYVECQSRFGSLRYGHVQSL